MLYRWSGQMCMYMLAEVLQESVIIACFYFLFLCIYFFGRKHVIQSIKSFFFSQYSFRSTCEWVSCVCAECWEEITFYLGCVHYYVMYGNVKATMYFNDTICLWLIIYFVRICCIFYPQSNPFVWKNKWMNENKQTNK